MMAASDVIELVDWLQQHRVDVWLNGGWGVDALLGHQTRDHVDLDITISAADRDAYTKAIQALGFSTCRVDNDFNWVLTDGHGRLVDVHLVDFKNTTVNDAGTTLYGPGGLPFEVGSLEGQGTIAGKPVKCETAESRVRGHTTYVPDETDYRDVLALCERFGIKVPHVFTGPGFHRPEQTPRVPG